jgi:hypothetical protein
VVGEISRERFSTADDPPQRREAFRLHGFSQSANRRGRLVEDGDVFTADQARQLLGSLRDLQRDDDEGASLRQGSPDFPDGEIEAEGVDQGPGVRRPEADALASAVHEVDGSGMGDGDALRLAG